MDFVWHFATRQNSDNRANALMLLCAMDERWQTEATLSDVLEFIRRERNEDVIRLSQSWFAEIGGRATASHLNVVKLAALRSPGSFARGEGRALLPLFDDPIRCRVLVREGLGDGLTRGERMKLLEERLDYILEQPAHAGLVDTLGAVGVVLGITETEVVVRELCSEILNYQPRDDQLSIDLVRDTDLLRRAIDFFGSINQHSRAHDGQPLLEFDEWALDFVIKPLSIIHSASDALRSYAAGAFSDACEVLERSEKVAHEVPCYRSFLVDLENKVSVAEAGRRLTRCLLTAGEAAVKPDD